MGKFWTEWGGTVYLCGLLGLLFVAVPVSPAGGYTVITQWKFGLYAGLTLLCMLLWLCFGEKRKPPLPLAVCISGWLLWSLLSALHSPWRQIAFLGGERREGFVTLMCYGFTALFVSTQRLHRRPVFWCFLIGLLWLDGVCLCQLMGRNPLHLYPEGLSWFDANVRYSGAYLGTVGNAGLTGTVLACACCFLFLLNVEKGGYCRLLLLPLWLTGWVLRQSGVDGPVLSLLTALLLTFPAFAGKKSTLGRYLVNGAVLLTALLRPGIGLLLCCGMVLAAGLLLERGQDRKLGRFPLAAWILLLTAGLLFLYSYTGYNGALQEATAILYGRWDESFGNGRFYLYRQIMEKLPEHLWLGTGPDTLPLWNLPPFAWVVEETGRTVFSHADAAHNEYLQTLACQGLPAALCFLCLPLLSLRRMGKGGLMGVFGGCALCYGLGALTGISACGAAPLFYALLALGEGADLEDNYDAIQ